MQIINTTFKNTLLFLVALCLPPMPFLQAAEQSKEEEMDQKRTSFLFEEFLNTGESKAKRYSEGSDGEKKQIETELFKIIDELGDSFYKPNNSKSKVKLGTRIERLCKKICNKSTETCELWEAVVNHLINKKVLIAKTDARFKAIRKCFEKADSSSVDAVIRKMCQLDSNEVFRSNALQVALSNSFMDNRFFRLVQMSIDNYKNQKGEIISQYQKVLANSIEMYLQEPQVVFLKSKYHCVDIIAAVDLRTRLMMFFYNEKPNSENQSYEVGEFWSFWTLKKKGDRGIDEWHYGKKLMNQEKTDDGLIDLFQYKELNPKK